MRIHPQLKTLKHPLAVSLERQAASKRQPKGWELQEHKVPAIWELGALRFKLYRLVLSREWGNGSL